jgi:hypothetical protein
MRDLRLRDELREIEVSLRRPLGPSVPKRAAARVLGVSVTALNRDLATKHGRIDVLQYVVGKVEAPDDHARLAERADRAHYDFGTVLFASYEDLIDFKNLAGRDQDLIDIRALREARGDIAPE